MNRGRKKLFLCFRPVCIIDDPPVKIKRSASEGDPVLTYIALSGGDKEIPKIFSSMSANPDGAVSSASILRKEKSSRRFSRAIKGLLFASSLSKKKSNRKSRESSFRSSSNLSTKSEKIIKLKNENSSSRELSEIEDMIRINSSRSSSIFSTSTTASGSLCSSCASFITSNSQSASERKGLFRSNSNSMELNNSLQRQIPTKKQESRYLTSNTGLCLLLVCLLVLILWGKVCAILCTSTCLLLSPRRINDVVLTVNTVESPDVDSEEYKKRVVMEGLLTRSRSRLL